jgi:hypothetical protein
MNPALAKTSSIALREVVMRRLWCGLIVLISTSVNGFGGGADEPGPDSVVVTDVDGKEHTLSAVKFSAGTRRLSWLGDSEGATEDAKKGPLALEVRESTSAMPLAQGIITLVPIASVESIRYDFDKEQVTIGVEGLSQPLTGALFYPRVNVIGISGTSTTKTASFTGGVRGKPSVKSITFAGVKPLARSRSGTSWNIRIIKTKKDEPVVVDNPTLAARNLKVLVSTAGGGERLLDALPIRKGEPIAFDAKLKRFELLANDLNTGIAAAEIETADGAERVIAIPLTLGKDKKASSIVGLVGEVDAGWKLFPLHTIKVITPSKRKIE